MAEHAGAVTMPEQPCTRTPGLRVRVTGRQLHRWVAAVVPYAAATNHIPALQCVQLLVHPQPDGTAVLYLTATNRYALATVRISIANTTSGTTPEVASEVTDGVTNGVAGEVQGWRAWDLTIPARTLASALTGITRRNRSPLELVAGPDGVTIRPEDGFSRYVPATGHDYLRWDRLLHTYNPATADSADAIDMTPAHLGLLARALPHAGHDTAGLRLVRTPSGAPMLAVTLTELDNEVPWFTTICMARPTREPEVGLPMWPELDQLTAELEQEAAA